MSKNFFEGLEILDDDTDTEKITKLNNIDNSEIITSFDNTTDPDIMSFDSSMFKNNLENKKYNKSKNYIHYTVENYALEKKLDVRTLYNYGLDNKSNKNGVIIPYLDINGNLVRNKFRNSPQSSTRFYWDEGNEITLYNLWNLPNFKEDYIIFVKGESDCHALMQLNIPVIGVPNGSSFKKAYCQYFDKFKKIYIHSEDNIESEQLIKKICSLLPIDKLYKISATILDEDCNDICDLNVKGKLDIQKLLNTSSKISVNQTEDDKKMQEHVIIGRKLIEFLTLKIFNGNLYTYQNGVYNLTTDSLLKNTILKNININAKKNLCNEVIEFVKNWLVNEDTTIEVDTNYINFQNGLFDIKNNCLIDKTSKIFSVNKVHVNYLKDLPPNSLIDNYLFNLMNGNSNRIQTLLQSIGYCLTSRTDMQQTMIWYRSVCF